MKHIHSLASDALRMVWRWATLHRTEIALASYGFTPFLPYYLAPLAVLAFVFLNEKMLFVRKRSITHFRKFLEKRYGTHVYLSWDGRFYSKVRHYDISAVIAANLVHKLDAVLPVFCSDKLDFDVLV